MKFINFVLFISVFRLLYLSDQIIQFILVIIEQLFTINKSDINPEISSILYDKLHVARVRFPVWEPNGPTMGWSLPYNMLEISGLMSDLLIVNNCLMITRINCII